MGTFNIEKSGGLERMVTALTTEWDGLQVRGIDPYSDVSSDNTSSLLMFLGNSKQFFTGLDVYQYEVDNINNLITVTLNPGTVIMDNISIKFTQPMTISLVSIPNIVPATRHIVVSYKYVKQNPAPIAMIKVISSEDFDSSTQLKLYTYKVSTWTNIIDLETWLAWLSEEGNWVDDRHDTGILFRSGDTASGRLKCKKEPVEGTDLTNKEYVDNKISSVIDPSSVLKTVGGVITGPINWDADRVPASSKELISKGYVDGKFLPLTGGNLTGNFVFGYDGKTTTVTIPYPTQSSHAANVEYVQDVLGTIDEGVLANYLKKAGGTMTGPIVTSTSLITESSHLINAEYAAVRYLLKSGTGTDSYVTGPIRTANPFSVIDDSCLINKVFADEHYISLIGNTSANPITGQIQYSPNVVISNGRCLVSRDMCDDRYVSISRGVSDPTVDAFKVSTSTINDDLHVINKNYADTHYAKTDPSAGYWNNTNSPATLNQNGDVKFNNGLMMKWGKATLTNLSSDTWTTIEFPSAFTTACYNVTATLSVSDASGNPINGLNIIVKDLTTTNFKINPGYYEGGSCTVFYQAIGK